MGRGRAWVAAVTDLAVAFALPLAYSVETPVCTEVCTSPWTLAPALAGVGSLVGILPAVLVWVLLAKIDRWAGPSRATTSLLVLPVIGLVGVFATVGLVALLLPNLGPAVLRLTILIAAALSLGLNGVWVALQTLRTLRPRSAG